MMLGTPDASELAGRYAGQTSVSEELVSATKVRAMRALMDESGAVYAGDALPPLWHWLFCPSHLKQSELPPSGDAHDVFSPTPGQRPRRSGEVSIRHAPKVGEPAARISTITEIADGGQPPAGEPSRTVVLTHEFTGLRGVYVAETEKLRYGGAAAEPAVEAVGDAGSWQHVVVPTPIMLFRYAALSYSCARVHFDRAFCAELGFPGLLVDEKLVATLLAGLAASKCAPKAIASFAYTSHAPIFDDGPFTLNGVSGPDGIVVWARRADGTVAMDAVARL